MHGYGMASRMGCENEAAEITDERVAATGCEGQRRLSPEMVMTETKQNQYGRRASVQLVVAGPRHYNRHTALSLLLFHLVRHLALSTTKSRSAFLTGSVQKSDANVVRNHPVVR